MVFKSKRKMMSASPLSLSSQMITGLDRNWRSEVHYYCRHRGNFQVTRYYPVLEWREKSILVLLSKTSAITDLTWRSEVDYCRQGGRRRGRREYIVAPAGNS